jgi:hypothetical protein
MFSTARRQVERIVEQVIGVLPLYAHASSRSDSCSDSLLKLW